MSCDEPWPEPRPEERANSTVEPVLRRLRREDADAVLRAFTSDPEMVRQGDVSDRRQAEAYVERLRSPETPHDAWAVTHAGELIGLVCVSVDEENKNGWVSYWMARAARGRGWTGRAVATVADWALTTRGLARLELGHRANNPASGAVARHAGFVQEGTERAKFLIGEKRIDVHTYGRLLSDPGPSYEPLDMVEDVRPETVRRIK